MTAAGSASTGPRRGAKRANRVRSAQDDDGQWRNVKPKLRVWVVFGQQLKFGDGRARLLKLIDERGSLRQAAAELRMSYRNAWGYLRELEGAAGFKFVERAPGGNPRSGMRLTARGSEFLARYGKFQRGLERTAARRFERAFPGGGISARPRPSRSLGSRARSARASREAG